MTAALDLSRLPPPEILVSLDFEVELLAWKDAVLARFPDAADVLELESEPLVAVGEASSERLTLHGGDVNDRLRGSMLAHAFGGTLDNLGALLGVERLVVVPADPDALPPIAEVMESDTAFRARIQLAPEAFTTAGTADAILARALEADGRVRSASVQSPTPGDVEVYVLAHAGDGTPDAATIAAVDSYLQTRRPLAIRFTTLAAQVIPYAISVELVLRPGPAAGPVIVQAQAAAEAFARRHHELGRDVTLSALHAALYIEGATYDVRIASPAANIVVGEHQAAFCTGISLTVGGRDV